MSPLIFLVLFLLFASLDSQSIPQNCTSSYNGQCITCASGYHIDTGSCYANIANCGQYMASNPDVCAVCYSAYTYNQATSQCVATSFVPVPPPSSGFNIRNFMAYTNFTVLSQTTALVTPGYSACYSYTINNAGNPSVTAQTNLLAIASLPLDTTTTCFKLTFSNPVGQGLAIYLSCYNSSTGSIQLSTVFQIPANQVVAFCNDYNNNNKCLQCGSAYVLNQVTGECFLAVHGCVQYVQNICISCSGFFLLIDNTCTSYCLDCQDSTSVTAYSYYFMLNVLSIVQVYRGYMPTS